MRTKVLPTVQIWGGPGHAGRFKMSKGLTGLRVAVPETRQRDLLAAMLQARGATVLQVPLVAIHDHPDQARVLAWVRRFVALPPALLILLTGEGLRRLLDLTGREGGHEQFLDVLGRVRTLCRGPKPERVLHELGLRASLMAEQPTTEGVIQTLEGQTLAGLRVGVQLYGDEPNLRLVDFLRSAGADVDVVAPYTYASKEEESRVLDLITAMASGQVDVLAFTSQGQYKRLKDVAHSHGMDGQLQSGMKRTVLAAVGPVVRDLLAAEGYRVEIMPERVYFMKPLVAAIERHFNTP
jgi:uroporphyrinogen-III synthase